MAMDDVRFWALIDQLDWQRDDADGVVAPLVAALTASSLEEIAAFEEHLARKLYALDGRAWAREMGEGWWGDGDAPMSVDAFLYARCAIVAEGRETYEAILADPTLMLKDLDFEPLLYVAETAWEAKTGELPTFDTSVSYESYANADGWPAPSRD